MYSIMEKCHFVKLYNSNLLSIYYDLLLLPKLLLTLTLEPFVLVNRALTIEITVSERKN